MPIWNRNPFYDNGGFSGMTPLGPSAPGQNDGPDDPPESGAPENSADGGLLNFDWSAQDFDPDIERMGRLYSSLYGSSPPSSLYDFDPVNYDPIRQALSQASEAQRKRFKEMREQAQKELERRQFQTLWTLMGPELFNAFTGAGADTGVQESLRLQHEARQRANELDRQLGMREVEQTRQDLVEQARLQVEEDQTNAQREREARRARYEDEQERREGMLSAASSLFGMQGERDAAEAQAQAERAATEREYQTDLRQDTIDLISELDDDPQLAPQVAAQIQALNPDWSDQQVKARVGQMLRASQQGALNAQQEGDALVQGSAQNPVGLVDNLVSSTLRLKQEYDQTDNFSPGWEGRNRTRPASSTATGRQGDYLTDLEGKRQALVYQLRRAANEAERRAYDLQKAGVQVPSEITNQIASLNKAQEDLKGITIDEGADADNMEEALKPVRSAVATLTGTQTQQSDPLRSNPATSPYIAAFEGTQVPQRGAQPTQTTEAPPTSGAQRDAEEAKRIAGQSMAIRQGQSPSEDESQEPSAPQEPESQAPEAPGDALRVSADELVEIAESTDPADMELAVSNLLRDRGVDVDDSIPVISVEDDGKTQTLAGVEQIAEAAQQMQDAESRIQVLRNFAAPFVGIYRDMTTITPEERARRSGDPEMALSVRYGVQPGDEVTLQEIGQGEAALIVNGRLKERLPVSEARSRLSEITALQERIRRER